ncbi:UNVERIFIED_CONTAM: hypothetical protein HDU68_002235 [Siphonaria sp. JEL0065]|nr:hypothetical protein HDU68_002235 [Siphonaria sp. JEL0065]
MAEQQEIAILKGILAQCSRRNDYLDPTQNTQQQQLSTSEELRTKGNALFKQRKWAEASRCYSAAIRAACSNELKALAHANRSASLLELNLFRECLLDIDEALDYGYPDNLALKLTRRRVVALVAIWRDPLRSSASQTEDCSYLVHLDDRTLDGRRIVDLAFDVVSADGASDPIIQSLSREWNEKLYSLGSKMEKKEEVMVEVVDSMASRYHSNDLDSFFQCTKIDFNQERMDRRLLADLYLESGSSVVEELPFVACLASACFGAKCVECFVDLGVASIW